MKEGSRTIEDSTAADVFLIQIINGKKYYLQLQKTGPITLARKGGAMMTSDPRFFYRNIEYRSQDELP